MKELVEEMSKEDYYFRGLLVFLHYWPSTFGEHRCLSFLSMVIIFLCPCWHFNTRAFLLKKKYPKRRRNYFSYPNLKLELKITCVSLLEDKECESSGELAMPCKMVWTSTQKKRVFLNMPSRIFKAMSIGLRFKPLFTKQKLVLTCQVDPWF